MARAGTLAQNEGDFRESIARLKEGQDHGQGNPQPLFDPQQAAEFRAEAIHGRKEEGYIHALEFHGFRFWSDLELAQRGQYPTGQGLWRHPDRRYELAFQPDDLLAMFATPEVFDRWVEAHKKAADIRAEMARRDPKERQEARIVLARG
jgi:hypothetical protein